MKHNKLYILVAGIVLFSMILAACATQATPTEVVVETPPTEVPVVPTEAPPTEVPPTEVASRRTDCSACFEGVSLSAPDCDYGGLIKEHRSC